ncbi:hypothetical protein G0Q06_09075 [Puniceicoccales bacterium CK1056]|uniref:Uncharacterized protein n=1 Tax=Oceanipulchritudo coccoides TaxID=2706888 RepID=A0A6B2M0V6_9BACT|nr:hypothetical protein [Oceanipulchritudo coccoides]NDV62601.1 hypothetical protein [Oceanipulchritudo coccoides]
MKVRPLNPRPQSILFSMAAIAGLLFQPIGLLAYESYHDPAQDDLGYCSTCHPGFTGGRSDTLHDLHTGNPDNVTGSCSFCHTGDGRDNPLIMWSEGDELGCMGCHGRDYGETVQSNYNELPTNGKAKNSGYGLRKHHAVNGVSLCAGCHPDTIEPYPENVIDPGLGNTVHYYLRTGDVSLGGSPVDPSVNEDSANDADSKGLDNDGDNLYDENDPDTVLNPDQVFISENPLGGFRLTWPTPSPNWILQENTSLDTNWGNLPVPAPTDRVNGFWFVDVNPAISPSVFYRLSDTP